MPESSLRHLPRALLIRWPVLLVAGAAVAAASLAAARRGPSDGSAVGELAAARPARVLAPRFSVPVEHHSCSVLPAKPDESVPREACGAEDGRLAEFEALADAGESSDPDSLHASALFAMLADDATEQTADAAITRLARALRLSGPRVPLLIDLSGAYLVRAQHTQNPRDLLDGLEYALEAAEIEPRNPEASFNAALAMQSLGLDGQADIAWMNYLGIDSTSAWAAEARARRSLLRHPPVAPAPEPGASEAEVRGYAERHPQEARLLGMDDVLGRWGRAVEAGDTAGAAKLLQLAEDLGIALRNRRGGGDLSLMDAVGAIRAAQDDPAATRALARAHRTYAAGQVMFWSLEQVAAGDSFALVVSARPPSPVLLRSAEAFYASALGYASNFSGADAKLQALLPRIDSVRHPALAGRVLWFLGTVRLKSDEHAAARAPYQHAARLFARAGETEYAGAVWTMDGEAAYNQRDTLEAYRSMHRGLTSLRRYRSQTWLPNALLVMANCATSDGMPRAAAVVQEEGVAVAIRQTSWPSPVEALLGRARIRIAAGRWEEAARDLDGAESYMEKIRADKPRKWLGSTVRYSRALIGTDSASTEGLDSAIAYFDTSKNLVWLLPALLRRADVHLAQGRFDAASTDLADATSRIRGLSQKQGDAALRVAMMEQARDRFDQLVMLHLRAGDTIAALQAMERGRVSFTPGYATATVARGRPSAPPGQVAVEYALIGNTLLTWTVRGSDVRLVTQPLDRGDFLRTVERVIAGLESPRRAASAEPHLERLYDLLIRPVKRDLGPSGTPLVILADGEVAGVPFEALLDSGQRRYLVQDHPLRFAATLAEAARPAPAAGRSSRALLVADPAFDAARYPTLDRLKGARAEVDSLKAQYASLHEVLEDTAATVAALVRAAPRADVIHYAGHAVFDDSRPERSALVLAGADTTGRLTADAVSALPLRRVRLVVLAACRTGRAREGRSGGLAGFSGALLAAGAGGVVGSLWEADDGLTQPLMLAFHRAYRRSGDPAAALREAQLELLHSGDPARISPAAWAGFRYIGS